MKKEFFIAILILAFLSTSCDTIPANTPVEDQPVEEQKETIDRFLIEENGKYGYINHMGEVVIIPQFENAAPFSEGLASVKIGGRYGYIDYDGKYAINPQFDNASGFSEGLAKVWIGGRCGFIDKEGKYVINPQFDAAYNFSEGLAMVKIGDWTTGKWGYVDKEGRIVINPQFDAAYSFTEGLAGVRIGDRTTGKWGFVDKEGRIVINPQFDDAGSFSKGLAAVKIGDRWGYVDKDGKYVINPQFDYADYYSEGFAAVNIGDKWGYIDKEGKYVINPQFEGIGWYNEVITPVKTAGKWVFIDKEGNTIPSVQFDDCRNYKNDDGLINVKIDGKWGCVDNEGRYVIIPQFDSIRDFSEGLAWAENDGRWGYINTKGTWVWQSQSQDNIGMLYRDAKSRGYIASEEEFRSCINGGVEKRKSLFNELKALGMKADEATFMEYVGYPMANLNKEKASSESIGQTHTSNVSDSQTTKEESVQWPLYSIPKVCSITIPPTMELRDENSSSGRLFSAISPSLYKLICENCDVFSDQSRIVFQPKGMNSSNPQDLDRATATYARIIIEFDYNYDVGQEDVKSMTASGFVEYDEIVGGQYKAEFEYAQQALGKTGSFVWHPTKREIIGGKYCLVLDYDRSGLQGMVKVKKYVFYYNGKEVDITCSYRISEKQKYEKDFEKVIRSIKFE